MIRQLAASEHTDRCSLTDVAVHLCHRCKIAKEAKGLVQTPDRFLGENSSPAIAHRDSKSGSDL